MVDLPAGEDAGAWVDDVDETGCCDCGEDSELAALCVISRLKMITSDMVAIFVVGKVRCMMI